MFLFVKDKVNEEPVHNEPVTPTNVVPNEISTPPVSIENETMVIKDRERRLRLKEMSQKFNHPEGLNELEKEPAYIRRNVTLLNTTPSSESEISKLSMGNGDEKKNEIKPNSFLHDNVD